MPTSSKWRLETLLVTPLGRALVPSLADFFVLALFAWMFAIGPYGWSGLLADADIGWHIRTGEYVLNHHSVPYRDLYSFSKPGASWYAWEWLSDVIFALIFRAQGLKGVVLFSALVITAWAAVLLRLMFWRGANMVAAVTVCLLSVGASAVHFLARPHIWTLLLFVISIWLLESDRRGASARLWILIPLTVIWTNLHGGFLVLILLEGLLVVGTVAENWLDGENIGKGVGRYVLLLSGCAAASLANPYGFELHRHILEYLRSDWIRTVIQEFQSPSFQNENMRQFEVLLLAGIATSGFLLKRHTITEALWILCFAHLALTSVRHVTMFAIVAGPIIALEASNWWDYWVSRAGKNSLPGIFNSVARDMRGGFARSSVWLGLGALALIFVDVPFQWPRDFPEQLFPITMVRRHGELATARVLTRDQWADYLIFVNYPQQRVFFDGRSDFYGPEIGEQYRRVSQGFADWREILERNRFNAVLAPVDWPLVSLLKQDPGWKVIEDDGKTVLMVPRAAGIGL